MIDFKTDSRLPYTITSSVRFGVERIRILRCTAKGAIASGAEEYDAPVLNIVLTDFRDDAISASRIITPDDETTQAIFAEHSLRVTDIDEFEALTSELSKSMKAGQREIAELQIRAATDAASSAFSTAQRVFWLLSRQMPRVQLALATSGDSSTPR